MSNVRPGSRAQCRPCRSLPLASCISFVLLLPISLTSSPVPGFYCRPRREAKLPPPRYFCLLSGKVSAGRESSPFRERELRREKGTLDRPTDYRRAAWVMVRVVISVTPSLMRVSFFAEWASSTSTPRCFPPSSPDLRPSFSTRNISRVFVVMCTDLCSRGGRCVGVRR